MLRLQSLVNASDTLCVCSIGRRRTLKSVENARSVIFRTHVTINRKDNALSPVPSTNTSQYSTNRFFFQNSTRLKVLCVKQFHTHIIPQCQAGKTSEMHNNYSNALIEEDNAEDTHEMNLRKGHSEKQLLHKQLSYLNDIMKEFPIPTTSLHNIYSVVQSQLKLEQALVMNYKETKNGWNCKCTIKWPEDREFIAINRSKKAAATTAALQCLHWLKDMKKLKNGLPVVFDIKDVNNSINGPARITMKGNLQVKLEELLKKYKTNIEPIILKAELPKVNELGQIVEDTSVVGPNMFTYLKHRTIISIPRIDPEVRNDTLRERLNSRKPVGYDLPINAYREKILKTVEENQVVLIKGDTGCGKTTQVPQFIMDSFAKRGEASKCNMLVSEPRKISAISLAERIAVERNETLGDVIGYKVKLQHKLPQCPGAILFCTTGILLRKLQENPNLIGCSHLIIDEVHERKIDVDIILALLKRVIKKNKDIKIIIMSATLNANKFQKYFDCASVDIPGMAYPVKMHFLDEISKMVNVTKSLEKEYFRHPQVEYDEIATVVQWISDKKPPGAILCFLPGWTEIIQVETLLKQLNRNRTKQQVFLLHSHLSYQDQQKIFEPAPMGVRKIILSTDIAETGITVRDVVYVVDCGIRKEIRWHVEKEIDTMQAYRISQSNLLQRKGRAGRVQSGESYHFITKTEYDKMKIFPDPEIKCVSLERVALDCKLCTDEKIENFLSELLDPPDVHVVRTSVQNLINLGALDTEENLTALGRKISNLSVPPLLGKTLIYSTIFGCLDPILTVVTILSINMELFRNSMARKEEIRSVKRRFHISSDHLALAWIYLQWETYFYENEKLAENFSDECGIIHNRMCTLRKHRNQLLNQIKEKEGLRVSVDLKHIFNKRSQSDEIIKAVVLAGMNNIIKHVDYVRFRDRLVRSGREFLDETKTSTYTTPESVNHLKEDFPNPYLTYVKKTFATDRKKMLVRESSIIPPLTVLLFCQGHMFGYEHLSANSNVADKSVSIESKILIKFSDKANVSLMCDEQLADLLFRFRDSLWAVVRYLVNNHVNYWNSQQELSTVNRYKEEMLSTIEEVLTDAAGSIDKTEEEKNNNVGIDVISTLRSHNNHGDDDDDDNGY